MSQQREKLSGRGDRERSPPTAINGPSINAHQLIRHPSPPHTPHSATPSLEFPQSDDTEDDDGRRSTSAREEGAAATSGGAGDLPHTSARVPTARLPEFSHDSPEAQAEMLRVVLGLFPNRSDWPDLCVQVIQTSTFAERARFIGDEGGLDFDLLFWVIQELESPDPVTARRWARFKASSPSRLNIRPPPVVQLANIPREFLPPRVSPPRAP